MSIKHSLFLSFDVEADGECPGINSLLSVGFAGFTKTGEIVFEYEANIKPLPDCTQNANTMAWWNKPEQQEAYKYVCSNQQDAKNVFTELNDKLLKLKDQYNIFPVAWPANYDWQWIHYYFHRFVGSNPLGFSARCIASYAWGMMKTTNPKERINFEPFVDPRFKHTHKALDDAKEQGAMLINMLKTNVSTKD